jgi:hypothetical protein
MSNRVPYEKTTRVEDNAVTMSTTQIRSSTKLGATGPEVFPIALGCMAMSGVYGQNLRRREHRHHPRGDRPRHKRD